MAVAIKNQPCQPYGVRVAGRYELLAPGVREREAEEGTDGLPGRCHKRFGAHSPSSGSIQVVLLPLSTMFQR